MTRSSRTRPQPFDKLTRGPVEADHPGTPTSDEPSPATAYSGASARWASDASLVYEPLARHLVARSPLELRGAQVLDVGTGTGVAAQVMRRAGARVVGVDLEPDMARYSAAAGFALVSDATRLPFAKEIFDLTVAAFLVNHLPDPVAGLAELRRVTRPGGAVLCSVFSTDRAAAKNAVDEVAGCFGYVPPTWYVEFQTYATRIGSDEALVDACERAGFRGAEICREHVDLGLTDPALVVRARLGMPQLRRFVDTLAPVEREALTADAITAVRRTDERFAPEVIEVVARP